MKQKGCLISKVFLLVYAKATAILEASHSLVRQLLAHYEREEPWRQSRMCQPSVIDIALEKGGYEYGSIHTLAKDGLDPVVLIPCVAMMCERECLELSQTPVFHRNPVKECRSWI